jgi:hypothetical protein
MDWLQNNWIWLAVAVGFIVMHFFGHGGHRHGRNNPVPGTRDTNTENGNNFAKDGIKSHAGHVAPPASTTLK